MSKVTIDAKAKFNALSNARHIFALKEEAVAFTLNQVIESDDGAKAIAITADGEVIGIFMNARSAITGAKELLAAFGDEQPQVLVKIRETAKKQSVYYYEIV